MKVVIAIDSFKGSLSSKELANSIESGITKVYPEAEVKKVPIADGGEGTVESLVEGTGGKFIEVSVKDPLMKDITATYGILGDEKTAIIEMATASGLPLVPMEERNPMETTTFGTGQLIKDALEKGCREFIIGIGGSATNDAGLGMMQALGYKFFDKEGNKLGSGGKEMEKVATIDSSMAMPELKEAKFLIACDVDNPFYGENGAAFVYARQKGADDEMILELDNGLKILATTLNEKLGVDIAHLPGAGAAGGLGGAFVTFLNGELKPGIDIILDEVGLAKHIEGADFVITGEGRMDFQSVMGKAPVGVSNLCKDMGIPVIALAGGVADDAKEVHKHGIESYFSIMNYPMTLAEAMTPGRASFFVESNTEEIFRLIKVCQDKFSK